MKEKVASLFIGQQAVAVVAQASRVVALVARALDLAEREINAFASRPLA